MLEFIQFLFSDWIQTIGVITGIGAVAFLAFNKAKLGWGFGIINAVLFTVLMFQYGLYADVLLNVYYLFTGILGLIVWMGLFKRKEKKDPAKITHLTKRSWLRWIGTWIVGTVVLGSILAAFTNAGAGVAYVDSFTTVGSLVAQFLLARKIFENWYLWIAVDIIDIGLYMYKDLPMVAGMTVIYMAFCLAAFWKWKKVERQENDGVWREYDAQDHTEHVHVPDQS